MSEYPLDPLPDQPRRRPRGRAGVAWLLLLMIVAFEVVLPLLRRLNEAPPPARQSLMTSMQVRYLMGASRLLGGSGEGLYAQAKPSLNTGPLDQRLPFLALAGELAGPKEALEQMKQIEHDMAQQGLQPTEGQAALLDILRRLFEDRAGGRPAAPSVSEEERCQLTAEMGWSGRLALTPDDSPDKQARDALVGQARRTSMALLVLAVVWGVLGLAGLVALLLLLALLVTRNLRPFAPGPSGSGGVYVEGFVVYMATFLGLSLLRAILPLRGSELAYSAVAMVLALVAGLAWPVLRGIPWARVRQDVGFTFGPHPLREIALGLVGYALVLPVFALGLLGTVGAMAVQRGLRGEGDPVQNFKPLEQPSHPIVDWIGGDSRATLLLIILVASILAPLVEETMFRGLLYRQLRDATWRWGRVASFLVSALLVSFIFAVIHPQGLVAVPALMGLAMGLNLLREWRTSLVPSMIVHGLHNGLMTALLFQVMR